MLRGLVDRGAAHREIGDRVHQQLEPGQREAGVPEPQAGGGSEIPAGAVTGDGDPGGVGAEVPGVTAGPVEHRGALSQRGREAMLGGQAVVQREQAEPACGDEIPADRVVGIQVAENEAAAVDVDDQWQFAAGARRPVGPDPDLPAAGVCDAVANGHRLVTRARAHRRVVPAPLPRLGDAELMPAA